MSFGGKTYRNEAGYQQMLADILEFGVDIPDRTGIGCRAIFDAKLIYDVDECFPFSTFRAAPLRMAFEEFWFFLRGETQTKLLEAKGIFFWQGNTSREFLDKRGLQHLPEGDMGAAYGAQMRRFGTPAVDQVADILNTLSKDRYSRRLLSTIWNPAASHLMALTPCWHSHQFVVLPNEKGEDTLHMKLINRSLDAMFGSTYAVQQYALYLVCVAKMLGYKVGKLSCDLTHVHLYENQLEYARESISRSLGTPGTIEITKDLQSMDDILNMQWSDVKVSGLVVNKTEYITERPPMAV